MEYAEVIVDISNSEVDRIFDYKAISGVETGSRVIVPFGPRNIEGYVVKLKNESDYPTEKIKPIVSVLDPYPVISSQMLKVMALMRSKYHLRIVDVLRLFIPSQMRGGKVKELKKEFTYLNPEFKIEDIDKFIKPSAAAQREIFYHLCDNGSDSVTTLNQDFSASALRNLITREIVLVKEEEVLRTPYKDLECGGKNVVLTDEQQAVVDNIIISQNETFLLHGVTGSGKTEVYIRCITDVLLKGRSAIMLVPEISLTPQVLKNFRSKFGDSVAILHSGLSAGERFDEWRRLISGEARVAVGARSAVFAPLSNVGLIIIDEEHDSSYVSESNPRYVTHAVAQMRKSLNEGCNLVMGSATPSIESYYYAKTGVYKLLELPHRINQKSLPLIEVVNMCKELYEGNNSFLSRKLEAELHKCIENGNQAIIFINRRGYSSYVMCRSCGYIAKCAQCDVSLVYHREDNVLKCHYCGNRYSALDLCPECKSPHIKQGYVGTEQVVEKLNKLFPETKILRMDNDTTQGKDAHMKILSEFAQRKAGILVGTQMIAKGHDFPDVTLVGIIDADMSLHFADFRSNERTFQLITQVSGRAGRENKTGNVVLQTYTPSHYVYRYAVKNDYLSFYEKECNLREVTKYPPFSNIVRILISSETEDAAAAALKNIFDAITLLQKSQPEKFAYLSAMRSPVKRIKNQFRMQIICRITADFDKIIENIYQITDKNLSQKISCFVEINPSNLS